MSKNNKERKVKGWAVVWEDDGAIDGEELDGDQLGIYKSERSARYNAYSSVLTADGEFFQTVVPCVISYKIPKKK